MLAPHCFIRIDDVGALTPALARCVETFLRAELPASYQIIPLKLTPDCARWLNNLRQHHPHLLEFGQHGLRHEMVVRGKRVWREFGPERSAEAQYTDIRAGKALLEDSLGPIVLFTPPQHKYDRNTLLAAERAGHSLFSAASYASLPYRAAYAMGRRLGWSSIRHHGLSQHGHQRRDTDLFELSVAIAIDNGGAVMTPPQRLIDRLRVAGRQTSAVGVMKHHEVYAQRAGELEQLADILRGVGSTRFGTIDAIARHLKAADSRCNPQDPVSTRSWDQTRAMSRPDGRHRPDSVSR